MAGRLAGYSVLVTRPSEQSHALCRAIETEGAVAIATPMIGIRALDGARGDAYITGQSDKITAVIFISRNAVDYGVALLKTLIARADPPVIYAVGVGTAGSLKAQGVTEVVTPVGEYSAEGLLQLEALQASAVERQAILIVRGVGGSEHLATSLRQRGAEVEYLEVYERFIPAIRIADALAAAAVTVPDIAVITSLEGLTNFADKIDDEGLELLFDMPLLVVGGRTAREVEKLGFTNTPVIVDNPSDDTVIETLARWVMDEV